MATESFLREIGGKSVVEQIVDNVTNAIINGELKPGDKIPTENELCTSMGVGRNSVREAIKILEAYGVLTIKRAEGTFVKQGFDSKMLYPVLYGIILQKDSANQIIELRKVIDVGILQLAIDKLELESLHKAEQAMQKLEQKLAAPAVDINAIFEADTAFHMVLVAITQNALLEGICSYVDQITKKSRLKAIEKFINDKATERFLLMHRDMLRVVKEKDRAKINEVVEKHYQYWEQVTC
ncbi:FadR/GntR family transcriptional regulator [Sporomusa termitida]|uniref:Fatty acid metabolism regulator protein n=1 Tax=Sporomusa termitida TaxID=2377 RepID=A0A517DZ49_9FIRM|nr:GntR family transcriptional regulator [Sporomusa termitida]QDR82637.1 Fatty acid metabolism regulator protein [Sporomusa termitida]